MKWLKKLFTPKVRLCDLPRTERRRIKALILGASIGSKLGGDGKGVSIATREDYDREEETGNAKIERRRAKAMLLGAGAGSAMRADADGIIRVQTKEDEYMTKDAETQRSAYLNTIRDIVITASRMNSILRNELCPVFGRANGAPERSDLKHFASLKKELAESLDEMREIEESVDNVFGTRALLRDEPHESIRVCLAILVAKAMSSEVMDAGTVAELASLAAGRDGEGLLVIHLAFCRDGIFRGHCIVTNRRKSNIGEQESPSLTQGSFELMLGLKTGTVC